MGYRDDAMSKLDPLAFLSAMLVQPGKKVGPNEVSFLCPFHPDTKPSANINTQSGVWFCHVCNEGGSPIDWLMKQGRTYHEALTEVGALAGMEPPSVGRTNGAVGSPSPAAPSRQRKLTDEQVKGWHEAALRNSDLLRWFRDKRGFGDDTLVKYELGWDGERVTIPIRDAAGKLLNVRRYMRDAKGTQGKMLWFNSGAESRLYPDQADPLPDEIVLVEGEWDAILMRQQGWDNAMTVTSGAGIWPAEFTPRFAGKTVTILYDNDDAGRKGAVRVANILTPTATVRIALIPNLPEKGDPTDFFVEQGRTVAELTGILLDATPFAKGESEHEEDVAPVVIALNEASEAKLRGVRLELPVLLSGKTMTPYTVPLEFTARCGMDNGRLCKICPMQEVQGTKTVTLSAKEPAVLSLINVSTEAQGKAMKQLAKAVPQCNRPQFEIHKSANIEELRLIPEIDDGSGEHEYVNRSGFFIGHGLMPNRSYRMIGYTHPHPKTQATVHLLSEAVPSQDNIAAFTLTPELHEALKVFQPKGTSVESQWHDVYDDFADTVHRIRDRFDMQVAYDLVWHSVISFTFNSAFVRRGWVECMVMGDSGQGKTEMAMEMLRHYRLGKRVQGEQSSTAGMIGGLEKIGDSWMLAWGAMPLNDKRLLVIDEAQGLKSEQIEGMSDVRATGIAEITKIRAEKTSSRVRIIWLANPVSGYTLGQHNQGVLAFKELFKKPEDVRRLDFGLAAASGEVDYARSINVRHAAATEPRYSSDPSRSLVLWAWSRRPDQIVFEQAATDLILKSATDMGRKYHASIPLVEPSDQRLKLARLAVATAARMHSTDPTGEQVVVKPEHVAFVVDYLDRIYNTKAMAYGEYSEQQRKGEVLEDDAASAVKQEFAATANGDRAIQFFRAARIFKRSELVDVVGWDDAQARSMLRVLAAHGLIGTTREGFKKNPAFITLLRELSGGEPLMDLEQGDEDPF